MSQARGHRLVRSLILDNSHFVAISQQIEEELRAWGVPSERLDRFASGIDVDEFAPGDSPLESQLPARPRAIFLGRLHPQKNLVVLLRAWQLVRHQCPTANLLLAGDGPQRRELEQLVDELQLTSQRALSRGAKQSAAVPASLGSLRLAQHFRRDEQQFAGSDGLRASERCIGSRRKRRPGSGWSGRTGGRRHDTARSGQPAHVECSTTPHFVNAAVRTRDGSSANSTRSSRSSIGTRRCTDNSCAP